MKINKKNCGKGAHTLDQAKLLALLVNIFILLLLSKFAAVKVICT